MGNRNSKGKEPVNIPKQKVNYNRQKDYFRPQSTICKVIYKEQSGTGALYGYEFPEQTWRTLLIACNQVLRISEVEELVGLRLLFIDETIGNVDMTPDWVKWLWTSPRDQLNTTVIEFSPTALTVLSRMQYARLLSSTPEKNANVTLYHHYGGDVSGNIVDVIGDFIQYTIGPEIRLGSPLLNEDRDVVGIHVGLWDSSNKSAQTTCKAINVRSILTEYTKYVLKMLNGRTENEWWLEKLKLIPLDEYKHIGGGGYGQVYKINLKRELTELAVKIVQDNNTSQVLALEKEYAMVTSLDNHPRIVQFFGFVRDVSKVRIMIVMEYLEGGSLADRLKDQKPVSKYLVPKYLQQILEGVDFLHQRKIYHSDIKPANILFNKKDDVKLCDFGISVGVDWQTESSATTYRVKGDFHYMSPERLNNASRSAANDIWSIGATFVEMISGQPLNHKENLPQFIINVAKYNIVINGMSYNKFLKTLSDDDFMRKIISRTLCKENRANCAELLSIVDRENLIINPPLKLVRRLPMQTLIRAGDKNPNISGMSYNSARDELFLTDYKNRMVRAMRVHDAGGLRDVYRAPHDTKPYMWSVCHMSDSDTLLVCSCEKWSYCLVALSRNGSEWREAQRVETDGDGLNSCALSDSRVLIGYFSVWLFSQYMELFRVESGPRIAFVHRINVPEKYCWFSATCGSDTLVAMSYNDNSVRVHRLRGDRLEELARIQLKCPEVLLWLADRLLVADYDEKTKSDAVIEFEVSDKRLERRRELIATRDSIRVNSLCAVNDGLAIFNGKKSDILHYSFA